MRKQEREKLDRLVPAMMAEISGVVQYQSSERSEWLLDTEFGRVRVSYYPAEDAKDTPWMPCVLLDFGAKYPDKWLEWDHWKQNFHGYGLDTADEFILHARMHLARFKPLVCA
jgi:hypothetical protein